MSEIELEDVANFIQQFRSTTFSELFDCLKTGYGEALHESRRTSPRFNVFKVLDVSHREVKTHSAFLTDLLNPYGSHDHGFVFLKAFLDYCRSKYTLENAWANVIHKSHKFPRADIDIAAYEWLVKKDHQTNYGYPDIVMCCEDLDFLCVIENKVGAPERKDQLKDYWDWMLSQKNDFPMQVLIFLTLDGRDSETAGDAEYFKMKYSEDIYEWLLDTLKEIESPLVKSVVKQYLQLILELEDQL